MIVPDGLFILKHDIMSQSSNLYVEDILMARSNDS